MTSSAEKLIASTAVEGGHAVIRVPLSEVHGLVVALGECPCKAIKSASTKSLRVRLRQALIKLQSRGMKK